jgi:hypothetical protein
VSFICLFGTILLDRTACFIERCFGRPNTGRIDSHRNIAITRSHTPITNRVIPYELEFQCRLEVEHERIRRVVIGAWIDYVLQARPQLEPRRDRGPMTVSADCTIVDPGASLFASRSASISRSLIRPWAMARLIVSSSRPLNVP